MKPLVELEHVTKTIKGKKIIDDLTFTIYEGEVFGFLGPNGAGKTTTIRMIVGLMKLSAGDIIICGHSIKNEFEDAIKQIGAIVENPEMYKFLTGYENLQQYARMHHGVAKEKIEEVIKLVGLEDRIHEKVKTYSLGMRQRLGIAQSLLHDPKVLILDEPTNGLDPAGIKEIRTYIRELALKKQMAVIVSSHLLSEMELMCDRISIIQKGKLIGVHTVNDWMGDSEEVYSFETGGVEAASKAMKQSMPETLTKMENGRLVVHCDREQVPEIISLFVSQGLYIYEVKQVSKTLEERFLEITETQEAM